jgi:hypothetical protein
MNRDQIINIFLENCGEPKSIELLEQYVDFVFVSKQDNSCSEYCENHHILPVAQFKQYKKSEWNIIYLKYKDHIHAHELLFITYPTRKNQRTLNFMKSGVVKNSNLVSLAAIKGWQNLKNNKEKYQIWLDRRIYYMKNNSSELQSRRAKVGWNTSDKYKKRSQINKNNWTPELKEWKSKSMSQYFKDNPQEIAERNQKRWDNMSHEKRQAFTEKMTTVNKGQEKRENAGKSIKKRWTCPEYKNKMSNRKTFLLSFTFISPTGETYHRDGIHQMIKEFDFSAYLINKFKNTNLPVDTTSSVASSLNTKGWIFIQHNENWHRKNK